ncbi:hypothetical protein ACSBL2_21605 [Pedobacter sp. AW31-3R]|uniref:hypothetical protein n=1 Tax=Pedobacter sp. AW31-3R TaxID=3445781 RepID=UPI003FA162F5
MIHLGKKLEEVAKERGVGATALSRQLNTTRENIYSIYTRESIDIPLLLLCCKVLNYNFFQHIYQEEPLLSFKLQEEQEKRAELEAAQLKIKTLESSSILQKELIETQRNLLVEREKEIGQLKEKI